jgi:hypothetical protein
VPTRDAVELDVECVQHIGKLKAVLLAFFVERPLKVEQGIGASHTCTGVAENV